MSDILWRVMVLGVAGLAACGDNVADRAPPAPQVVVRIDPASTADCAYGGSVVRSGVDHNGNGALDDEEVANQTPLCNAPPVQPPPAIVVRLTAEPIGAHCAIAGTAVQSGPDRNGNGVLDDDEVIQIDYVCGEALLTRLAAEPASARCVAGGVVFQVGRDRDHDGVLGDDEVEQTELACGNELSRDVTIASAADAAALAKIEVINGSVTLDASGLSELALPALSVVRGALEIRNQAALRHLAMPVLQSVAGQLAVIGDAQLASVELPLLTRVGSLVIDGNPALPDLTGMAALGNVPGDIQITNNGALTAADLPIRETVGSVTIDGNAQLGVVALSVDRLGPLHIGSNPVLTSVSLVPRDGGFVTLDRVTIAANPQLAVVSIITSTLASLAIDDNPALTDITVSSFFITGDLAIRGNGLASVTLSTPSLVEFELGGSLTLSGPITALHAERAIEALGDCTLDTTRLVTFDPVADGLTCQGALHVIGNAQLTRMPGLSVGGSLELRSNPVLTSLPFLVQHELAGDLIVADNAVLRDAPALERIDHVAGNVTITGNPALKGAFAAALVRIDGAAVFDGNDSLGDVGLAALRHVGSLSVSHSGLLTVLALPSLTEVSRIDVRGNPSLVELQLPRLRQADMGVFDNPHLPACAVDALFTGLLGDHQQSGNDDAAGCAP